MLVRIGEFEVDAKNGRLLKHGVALPLREQAFQVLLALIERPGETVTRSELRNRLWSGAITVDFETGLNSAVSRLRDVLNDDPNAPQFIETVPKRGYRFKATVLRTPSVAVMPLRNRGSDAEYLNEGLTEDLIGAIARIEGVQVIAASMVRRFKNGQQDAKQLAAELGVQLVVEGSFRRTGSRIEVHVHLVNGANGFDIWSEHFDENWSEVLSIQDRVASALAAALKRRILPAAAHTQSTNSAAYEAYLRGHFLVARYPVSQALKYFADAMELDPQYALPYHGTAIAHILRCLRGEAPAAVELSAAEKSVNQGLRMAPELSQMQNTLGMLRMFQCRWEEAESAYKRALTLDAANPYAHMMYALHNSFLARHELALRHARQALALEPLHEMTNFRLVQSLYYARQFDAAIEAARTAINLAPNFPGSYRYLAFALIESGSKSEALAMGSKALKLAPGAPFYEGDYGYIAAITGHPEQARATLDGLLRRRENAYCPAFPVSLIYCGLGDGSSTLEWLEKACDEEEPYVASALVFPGYDWLRSHPRFKLLLQRTR